MKNLRRHGNKSLYWNFIFRGVVEAYIIIAICALINVKELSIAGDWEALNAFLTISVLLGLIGFPIITSMFLHKKKD